MWVLYASQAQSPFGLGPMCEGDGWGPREGWLCPHHRRPGVPRRGGYSQILWSIAALSLNREAGVTEGSGWKTSALEDDLAAG